MALIAPGPAVSTPCYRRLIAEAEQASPEMAAVAHEAWDPTPWVLEVFTDEEGSARDGAIQRWCLAEWGPGADQGRPAHWRRGSVTFRGFAVYGFRTELLMLEFQSTWGGSPDAIEADAER